MRGCVCLLWCAAVVHAANYLLPGDVTPRHYDVRLAYDIDSSTNFSMYGAVDILLTANMATSQIVLHAEDLSIVDKIKLVGPGTPEVRSFRLDDTFNFLTIVLNKEMKEKENYTLSIPFYGNLKPRLNGVYISSYVDKKTNKTEFLVTTQFEPISARKGFPCFDEPAFKATFSIKICRQNIFRALSNMPQRKCTKNNLLEDFWPWADIEKTFRKKQSEFVWDEFEKSKLMSTYLVAFVISKFSYKESPSGLSKTPFKIWARKDVIDQTNYAANIGPKIMSFFEEFFNIPFPLPKQDMVAIPDFASGAMENWGLITYREMTLLYDKDESSFFFKEGIAGTIAHELSHQWFGDLVTMKWWSDLWLNEGFATYFASIGVHHIEPSWHSDNNAVFSQQSVLQLDALGSSRPVSVKIEHPARIAEIFDAISYQKGLLVIRMLNMFLGQSVFKKALHNYLTKYSYSNAEQDDLWSEMTATSQEGGGLTSNVSVKEVMDTWTTQAGYPLLTVTRDYNDSTLIFTQKRYLNFGVKSNTSVSWWIPMSIMSKSEVGKPSESVQWLSNTEGVNDEHHRFKHAAKSDEWILFNYDIIAPYRINYDKRNWQLLIETLNSEHFTDVPVLGRVQLLSDAFELAWSEQLDYSTALDLSNYLQREKDYFALSAAMTTFEKIGNTMKRTAEYGLFQKFIRHIIGKQFMQAGGLSQKTIANADDIINVKMQELTSKWACRVEIPSCKKNSMELFHSWMNEANPDKNNPIPLDLREIVYCDAIRQGSAREWMFMLERKRRANTIAAATSALIALTCTREAWILTQYLEWTITDNTVVRVQDASMVIPGITMASTVGYYVARDFIYYRIADLSERLEGNLGPIMKILLQEFTTQQELDEFLKWRENNKKYLEKSELAVSQGIEEAKVNIAWLKRNKKLVSEKFREYSSGTEDIEKYYFRSHYIPINGLTSLCPTTLLVLVTTVFAFA